MPCIIWLLKWVCLEIEKTVLPNSLAMGFGEKMASHLACERWDATTFL